MKPVVFQIMGTHGSGKTTVARSILGAGDAEAVFNDEYSTRRPQLYRVTELGLRKPLFVLGPYTNACGGCDALNGPVNVVPLLERYHKLGPILIEGAIISSYGRIGEWGERLGERHVYLFLDTPLAVCQKRVNARRKKDGKPLLVDTFNIDSRWKAMRTCYTRLESMGKTVRWIGYRNATQEVLDVIKEYAK